MRRLTPHALHLVLLFVLSILTVGTLVYTLHRSDLSRVFNSISGPHQPDLAELLETQGTQRVPLAELPVSQHKCLATGGRRAYCQSTTVCIHADHGLFLLGKSFNTDSLESSAEGHRRSFSGDQPALMRYWHDIDDATATSPQQRQQMANIRVAELSDSLWYKPAVLKRLLLAPLGSRSDASSNTTAQSAVIAEQTVIWHPNELLVVGASYFIGHLTHLLFNTILPLYDVFEDSQTIETGWRLQQTPLPTAAEQEKLFAAEQHGSITELFPPLDPFFWSADRLRGMNRTALLITDGGGGGTDFSIPEYLLFDRMFLLSTNDAEPRPERYNWFQSLLLSPLGLFPGDDPSLSPSSWLQFRSNNMRATVRGTHCYPRASYGSSGGSAFHVPRIISPRSIRAFRRRVVAEKLRNFTYLQSLDERHYLKSMLMRSEIIPVNQYNRRRRLNIYKPIQCLNITLLQRLNQRSILNIDETFEEIQRWLRNYSAADRLKPECFNLRLVQFDHDAPFEKQVYIFAHTQLIILVHGNAMGNLMFLPFNDSGTEGDEDARKVGVIEIKPPAYPAEFFESGIHHWFPKESFIYRQHYCTKNLTLCRPPEETEREPQEKSQRFILELSTFQPLFMQVLEGII